MLSKLLEPEVHGVENIFDTSVALTSCGWGTMALEALYRVGDSGGQISPGTVSVALLLYPR
ncbi:MAG: hypothetical protein EOP09_20445 [Proteobacteria bacterium]|nr:MAG: hypothetical protein EOP09_20445 [Pseudomonadota bacterium]